MPNSYSGTHSERDSQILWEDGERSFRRGWRVDNDGKRSSTLFVVPSAEHPSRSSLDRFRHEYELRDELDATWAVRPIELVHDAGQIMLKLEDPGGELLDTLLGAPIEIERFLRLAVGIAVVVGKLHQRGLVHKDIKPVHILANDAVGTVRLTGFGIASRLVRERQSPHAPETLAGTLAYMAPEQTGRMNRSIDSRSDLYAVGVTLYQMLAGALPFSAVEPMEWVHCHLARRPVPPSERVKDVPEVISAIVMKLLAKRAEDRYQTAAGLERDLRHCQTEWEAQRRIEVFPLGEYDTSDRLLIPEKLYGRQREVETLLAAFDRVVKDGAPELMLVSGYSGIGKSSVVNEIQPLLVPPRAVFASGKFDQYKRDVPYWTLIQAFQSLIRPLLSKSEGDLARWRNALREALGPNARLIVDLVPEVKAIIGDQPPAPEVPPQDAQRRFQLVISRFIGVFARQEHPLALFLDDLQWLDTATLDLLEDLLTRSDLRHVLLIGAYRDNEVDADHPLIRKLEAIKSAGGKVNEIALGPLDQKHLGQLLADALSCESERSAPLAQLVHDKTDGNPFFAIQFISSLAEEKMLAFDQDAARWSWNLDRIHSKGYTDNVVELMVGRLSRLPVETQKALQCLACLGNVAQVAFLTIALDSSEDQVHASLLAAVRMELVEHLGGSYKFAHDRVQEAAYSLIPEELRGPTHLRIGRLFLRHISPQQREETIFDVVNQLDRGADLITSPDEREQLAGLNLIAGKRAKASTAYASALKYLNKGADLLSDGGWARRRELMFALELALAECEFLTGELVAADERLTSLSSHTTDIVDRSAIALLHLDTCTELVRFDRAVAVALDYLRLVGIDFSPHPTEDEILREYEQVWLQLGDRTPEEVTNLPLMSDPESLVAVEVLTRMMTAAQLTDRNLDCLTVCRAVNLSLRRGNCEASCLAYVMLGRIAIARFRDYKTAFRFGQVGYELVEGRGLKRFQGGTYLYFASWIARWMKHVRTSIDLLRRAFDASNKIGDLRQANYANIGIISDLLVAGDALSDLQREAELALAFTQNARFSGNAYLVVPQLALIRSLRGLTPRFGSFNSEQIEEAPFELHLEENPNLQFHACWYWVRKIQARYFAGDYADALGASAKARGLLWTSLAFLEEAEYHFYSALSHAASYDCATADERVQHLKAIATHLRQLEIWAEHCPENFENRAALVNAEIAGIEGRDLDAMRLYEKAIQSSRSNGFINNEGLAYERASEFYRVRGFDQFADTYLRSARACYASWGADGKVRQLDQLHPGLRQAHPPPGAASTITTPIEGLDLATVIRVSQAVSREIVLEKLLDIVMRTAMEHAGAERGVLIVPKGDELRAEAESSISGNDILVLLKEASAPSTAFPESIVRYVMRTLESVILDDATSSESYSADPYILQHRVRSILCLPLLNHAKLAGILYLENNLASRVFTPQCITVLKVLASQAAISLENTRLYRDVEYQETKIRRLVDANIIGIFVGDHDGRIVEANDAFLHIVGYDREDLLSGHLKWTELNPPEWRERALRNVEEMNAGGTVHAYEKEYLRKDGSRVPVLFGAALLKERNEGVAFVLDLTERKRSEQARHQLESDLAHVNRLSMLGELSASLAHEVKHPIATARNNARAAQNFLKMQPPDLGEVEEAVGCVVGDVDRAGEIIDRITEQVKKAPLRKELFDLNSAINEVIWLARSIATKNGVSIETRLADGLLPIQGDRIQLQQVIMNLILNAVEAMSAVEESTRKLMISTEQDQSGVLVAVRDSGPGIEPAQLERVFQSFYTTKDGGTGMGLSVCRSIIEAHGGKLWATANEPRGAVFQFTLPGTELAHDFFNAS